MQQGLATGHWPLLALQRLRIAVFLARPALSLPLLSVCEDFHVVFCLRVQGSIRGLEHKAQKSLLACSSVVYLDVHGMFRTWWSSGESQRKLDSLPSDVCFVHCGY